MTGEPLQTVLERIYDADIPARVDVEEVLHLDDERDLAGLFAFAADVRREFVGDGVLLRGIIEFSNICRNTCLYCGLNRHNHRLGRYRLTSDQVLAAVENIAAAGLKTVVLQSGEEDNLDTAWLGRLIEEIRSGWDMAITLSVGERPRREYQLWKDAGADRYLLKMETTDPTLYQTLHPGMSFDNRLRCLRDLAELGYQQGSGNLVGLPGQTVEMLANDILFFQQGDFDMISVGPLIPHPQTALADMPPGDLRMTLKVMALTRIVSRNAHIPANTAIGSLHGRDERPKALAAGANVIMPNFTPEPVKPLYEIYPGKIGRDLSAEKSLADIERMVAASGRWIDYSRGDSLKTPFHTGSANTQRN
jgi:biotin synthase